LENTYLENGQLENGQLENRHLENEKYSTWLGLVSGRVQKAFYKCEQF